MDRNIYIDNIDLDVAKKTYNLALNYKPRFEYISVNSALGRVTRGPIYANFSSPYYNASAMDGIAVICKRTNGASEINPVKLKETIDFIYVNTGNVINQPYDAVIMIEDVTSLEDGEISIITAAHPWQHIRPIGEDIVANEMILPSNHKIRGIDLGALLSGGVKEVEVFRQISVGILPTGTEIINNQDDIAVGKIIDSNSAMFQGLITENGGNPNRYRPTEDNFDSLKEAIIKGVDENDIMIVNAGSSAGTKDFTATLIKELGEVIIHGIAIKPGKPTILGIINNKPIIGIPGYPVSAYISYENFVKPLLLSYSGLKTDVSKKIQVTLSKRVVSSFKHQEKLRVTIGYIGNKYVAVPLSRGAGTTMSLVKADGIITIPKNIEGLEAGENIEVELLKPLSEITNTLVSIGSHDIVMDILRDKMPLASSHVGSIGGIMALRQKECHIAPIHLLDSESGEYNISYVKKYFKEKKMVLIKGVKRSQGFIVQPGNPKNIKTFSDLIKHNIRYVNRQRGAGTRLLLDFHLKSKNIDSEKIIGYERMMPTHMAVAIAVQSGTADVGLGIKAAAESMGLGFVEITYEDYDFLLEECVLTSPLITKLIDILKSNYFKDTLKSIGGYDTTNSGSIIKI
ncbi:MAG: molybdopterin biosynthesis protein [Spirochaetaceae bacterium]